MHSSDHLAELAKALAQQARVRILTPPTFDPGCVPTQEEAA